MKEEPETTPDENEEPAEPEAPKTGAEAWKERRAQILARGAAAQKAAKTGKPAPKGAENRVVDQRRANADREAAQHRSKNTGRTQRRSRG